MNFWRKVHLDSMRKCPEISTTSPAVKLVILLVCASICSSNASHQRPSNVGEEVEPVDKAHKSLLTVGQPALIPCGPTNNIQNHKYTWEDSRGRVYTNVTRLGALVIDKALPRDTGKYVCRAPGNTAEFQHEIIVLAKLTPYMLSTFVFYLETCNLDKFLVPTSLIIDQLCETQSKCPYTVKRRCRRSYRLRSNKLTLYVSTLVGDDYVQPRHCNIDCVRKDMLDQIHKNYKKVPKLNKFLIDFERDGVRYDVLAYRYSLGESCFGGYQRKGTKFCEPCSPGYHRSTSMFRCKPCAVNTYQPSYEATSCIPCKSDLKTATTGASHKSQCV